MASRVPDGRRLLRRLSCDQRRRNRHCARSARLPRPMWRKSRRPRGSGCNGSRRFSASPKQTIRRGCRSAWSMRFQSRPRFSDGECVLTAQEYFEGHLDWYAFDANPGGDARSGDRQCRLPKSRARPFRPRSAFAACRRRGSGNLKTRRWISARWTPGRPIWLRMLLVEFALDYGNDWFVIPDRAGRRLALSDAFVGHHGYVRCAHADQALQRTRRATFDVADVPAFAFTRERSTKPASNLFFLPPSLVKSLERRADRRGVVLA